MKAGLGRGVALSFLVGLVAIGLAGPTCKSAKQPLTDREYSIRSDHAIDTLLQRVIDYRLLQQYYFADDSDWYDLCIMGGNLPRDLKLMRFGRPVKVVGSLTECQNCIVFEELKQSRDTVQVLFKYPPEGVVGRFTWVRRESSWLLIDSLLAES